jgi:hypothetical protein
MVAKTPVGPYASLDDAARAVGVSSSTIATRIKNGQDPFAPWHGRKAIPIAGYPSLRRAAIASGFDISTVSHRRVAGQNPVGPRLRARPGSGTIDKKGYRVTYVDGRSQMEHRLVMERIIDRKLYPHEEVHHKNGQRADNRDENLELWSHSQPSGQRIEDKVAWAREFLELYKDFCE